jgi:RimJ/RimL family protein N-acetyltransferase
MSTFLETDRLVLRQFTQDDAQLLFDFNSDPDVIRYVGLHSPTELRPYQEFIREKCLAYYNRYATLGFWAAVEKATGQFIGWFHLRPALDYRFATEAGYQQGDLDLGYRLRKSAWGKGYATEGAKALIEIALRQRNINRVVAATSIENVASQRVLEKVGLTPTSQFTLPGYERPVMKYELLCRSDEAQTMK